MKKLLSTFIFIILFGGFMLSIKTKIVQAESVETKNVINVYLIGGQSNAVGYGVDTNNSIANSDSRYKEGFENVLYYGDQERVSGNVVNKEFQPVKLGLGQAENSSGAEIGIASMLGNTNSMNAVVKCAWGATHLYPDTIYDISKQQGTWTSPSYISKNNVDTSENKQIGRMYSWFKQTVTTAIAKLEAQGYTPVIKGMWWMQGEAEMHHKYMADAYEELLISLIQDIRTDLTEITRTDCSEMPFIFGLPTWNKNYANAPTYEENIRNTFKKVAENEKMINVDYIDCYGLKQHDMWHFDAAGQKLLGEQFVRKINKLHEGTNINFNEQIIAYKNAHIRFETPSGMRFGAKIANYDAQNNYQYGLLIVPANYLISYTINNNYHQEFQTKGIKTIDLKCHVLKGDFDKDGYEENFIQGSITDLKYQNINRDFVGIGYIKDQHGNYLYTSTCEKANVAYVASMEMTDSGINEDIYQQLTNYVNAGVNHKNGVDEANAYDPTNFDFSVDNEIEINIGQIIETKQINVIQSPKMNYYIKYTSFNEDIAKVDENGFITGINAGNTIIKIECAGIIKEINVTVKKPTIDGIIIDGVRDQKYGEFVDIITLDDNRSYNISAVKTEQGIIIHTQGTFNTSVVDNTVLGWWHSTNFEFTLNGGNQSYVNVKGQSSGVTQFFMNIEKTNDGKYLHTFEIFVDKSLIDGWTNDQTIQLNYAWCTPDENAAILSDMIDYRYEAEWGNNTHWHSYHRLGGLAIGFNTLVDNLQISSNGLQVDLPPVNNLIIDGNLTTEEINTMGQNYLNVDNGIGTTTQLYATIIDGDIYLSFKITHNAWSIHNKYEWWKNDNIEMYINSEHIVIMFWDGKMILPHQVTYGKTNTTTEGNKLVTTLELYIKGNEDIYKFIVNANGTGFGWNNLMWREDYTTGYLTQSGISEYIFPVVLEDYIVLDGQLTEDVWNQTGKTIETTANETNLKIRGTKTKNGILFGVNVIHSISPDISLDGSNNWYSFMNVEFRINGLDTQFIAISMNTSTHGTFSCCSTIKQSDGNYYSTFEIYIPYSIINASIDDDIFFTVNGWFETGWCWIWGTSNWEATHKLTSAGIIKL